MSRISQRTAVAPLGLIANGTFQTSTDASLETLVGTRFDTSDGRELILVQAGAVAVDSGKLYQDAAVVANHVNCAVTAFTAYSNNGNVPAKVTVTLGATAVTANQYAGGLLVVNDNAGEGQTLRIASHPAADASASLVVTLEDSPITAITTASEVTLLPAHGNGVIVMPTTATGSVCGVSLYPIAAAAYGFLVTKGITACLNDGALTIGSAVSPSNAVAGAVENAVVAQGLVGNAVYTGVDTEYRPIYVNL